MTPFNLKFEGPQNPDYFQVPKLLFFFSGEMIPAGWLSLLTPPPSYLIHVFLYQKSIPELTLFCPPSNISAFSKHRLQ